MIDLHCHILPGIDDGPDSFEDSVAMAKIAVADGIETIVATPHIREVVHPVEFLSGVVALLNFKLQENNIPVEILLGGDVSTILPASGLQGYSINQSRYILIEFPHTHVPDNAKDIIFALALQGLVPIITHPERNPSIIQDPEVLFSLLNGDVYVQVTADSLTGTFGSDSRECARYLVKKGVVHFLASDAHSADYRLPVLSKGLRVVEKMVGKVKAKKLVLDNPAAVIADEPLHLQNY